MIHIYSFVNVYVFILYKENTQPPNLIFANQILQTFGPTQEWNLIPQHSSRIRYHCATVAVIKISS